MNKADFIKYIAGKYGILQKEADEMITTVFDSVYSALSEGNSLKFVGFGNFKIVEKSEREGRNPATGEVITIPAKKVVKFEPSKALKESVNL